MNNPQSPLIPQGSLLEQKNQGRARVKIAVFIVLAVHGIGLLALLMQGCRRNEEPAEPIASSDFTNAPIVMPDFVEPTNPAPVVADTNLQPTPLPPEPAPGLTPAPTPEFPTPAPTPLPEPTPTLGTTQYKVVKGDTFSGIAGKFRVTVKSLTEANPGVEATKLQIGQTIQIPAPAPAAATPSPAAPSGDGTTIYEVKSGDTLSRIAGQFGVTVKAIRNLNSLTTDRITVGQKLKIPAKTAATK